MSENKPDLNALMSMLSGGGDLNDKINQISKMMGSPEKGEKVKSLVSNLMKQDADQIKGLSRNMAHTDPAINLLVALGPYLNSDKQAKLDQCLKTLNTTYFVKQLAQMSEEIDINE